MPNNGDGNKKTHTHFPHLGDIILSAKLLKKSLEGSFVPRSRQINLANLCAVFTRLYRLNGSSAKEGQQNMAAGCVCRERAILASVLRVDPFPRTYLKSGLAKKHRNLFCSPSQQTNNANPLPHKKVDIKSDIFGNKLNK